MNKIKLIKELEKYPVFNIKILAEIIKKKKNYAKLVMFRLKKQKLIFELEKNKYTMQNDPLIIASNIIWPNYLSFWTALRYHNMTEQLPQNIFVVTTRAKKKSRLKFKNIDIIFTKIQPKYFFGFTKERYGNFNIFVAEPEKALIDSLLFRKISFSEISSIVKENINKINIDKFIDYLLRIKNKAMIKRCGFLFDKLGSDHYNKLKKYISAYYIYLDYTLQKKGKKSKKWKVIENVKL